MYNGISIPVPGFGTYKAVGDLGRLSMETAVAEGYRHFDTASFYKNEKELGEVLVGSGLPRKDFFIPQSCGLLTRGTIIRCAVWRFL